MTDMYTRPSRAEIAARVNGEKHETMDDVFEEYRQPKPEPTAHKPLENFAAHVTAGLRAKGWTPQQLAEAVQCNVITVTKATNANGISMDIAAKMAAALGKTLAMAVGPYECGTCHGEPPQGFRCLECDTEGARS